MSYSDVFTKLFTVLPTIDAFFAVLFVGCASEKRHLRGPLLLVVFTVAIVGYAMLIASETIAW